MEKDFELTEEVSSATETNDEGDFINCGFCGARLDGFGPCPDCGAI